MSPGIAAYRCNPPKLQFVGDKINNGTLQKKREEQKKLEIKLNSMKLKTFGCAAFLLMLSTVVLYAQPHGLPRDGADPDAPTLTYSISNANPPKNTASINPADAKSILHLTITPAFGPDSNGATIAAINVYKIKIMRCPGSIVQTATTGKLNWQTDISKFRPGTYMLQVTANHDSTEVGKVTFVKPNSFLARAEGSLH